MAKQTIDTGIVANDGTGDPIRNALIKINDNTDEIYTTFGNGSILNAAVTKTGTPADNQVTVWTADGVIEGTANFTFDDSTAILDVTGAVPVFRLSDSGTTGTHDLSSNGVLLQISADPGNVDVSSGIQFLIDATEVARITDVGLFGIGATPLNLLHLEAADPQIRFVDTDAIGYNLIGPAASDFIIDIDPGNADASSLFRLDIDGTEILRVTDAGRLGLGNTPNRTFDITGVGTEQIIAAFLSGSAVSSRLTISDSNTTDDSQVGIGAIADVLHLHAGGASEVDIDSIRVNVGNYITTPYQINVQTGTAYTAALTDPNGIITMNNASPNVLTIDPVGTTAYPVGTVLEAIQLGAGATTITAGTGVTLNGVSAGSGVITAQYDVVKIRHVASDVWIMNGDHGAVA